MSSQPKFITIKKVVVRKDDSIGTEQDSILISEIKNFRPWHKDHKEKAQVEGDMCQVSLFSTVGKEGFYNIKINESADDFGKRLGPSVVIGLDA
jgi:hypothetical protein